LAHSIPSTLPGADVDPASADVVAREPASALGRGDVPTLPTDVPPPGAAGGNAAFLLQPANEQARETESTAQLARIFQA
jgi:hypothetical protein